MNRRHALRQLFGGFAASGLLLHNTLYGQSQPAAPQSAPAATGSTTAPSGAETFRASEAVIEVLNDWERYTRNIQKLEGAFQRYIYDSVFSLEKRANGQFWYEAPDKGRIDFRSADISSLPKDPRTGKAYNPSKQVADKTTAFYTVESDIAKRWICRGDILIDINDEQKTYETIEIPPQMRGQNITASPLPFLFGVSAEEMQRRYFLAAGNMHDPQGLRVLEGGRRANPQIHLIAAPRLESIAREWSRAEVLLDPGLTFRDDSNQPVYVPTAIRLLDPTGNQETVYVFDLKDTKLNSRRWFGTDPFAHPGLLSGLKHNGHHRHAAEPSPKQRDAATPGRATVN